jgi:hypothetical protein
MPDTTFHVFISHIHEEAALGTVIKNNLEDAFSGRVEAFVSSDPRDNPGGDEWLNKIRSELKHPQNRMLVSVLSPASISESWISIEAGATWILGRKVFVDVSILCPIRQQFMSNFVVRRNLQVFV